MMVCHAFISQRFATTCFHIYGALKISPLPFIRGAEIRARRGAWVVSLFITMSWPRAPFHAHGDVYTAISALMIFATRMTRCSDIIYGKEDGEGFAEV